MKTFQDAHFPSQKIGHFSARLPNYIFDKFSNAQELSDLFVLFTIVKNDFRTRFIHLGGNPQRRTLLDTLHDEPLLKHWIMGEQ